MTSTLEPNPAASPPARGGLATLPAHVIWTKDEGKSVEKFFSQQRTPPPKCVTDQASSPFTAGSTQPEAASLEPAQRIFRLERNLRFLKSQHQRMLSDLHEEIEKLKSKNKELQFQLIIGMPLLPENPNKELIDSLQITKLPSISVEAKDRIDRQVGLTTGTQTDGSPIIGTVPGHFANWEEELGKLRLALEDAENRNACLSTLIAQLKRSHVRLKSTASLTNQRSVVQASNPQSHRNSDGESTSVANAKKLKEYEELVTSLRKENREQKQESAPRGQVGVLCSSGILFPLTVEVGLPTSATWPLGDDCRLTYVRSCLDHRPTHSRLSLTGSNRLPLDLQRLPRLTEPSSANTKQIQARKTTELPRIHPRSSDSLAWRAERLRSTYERKQPPLHAGDDEDRQRRWTGWIGEPNESSQPHKAAHSHHRKAKPKTKEGHSDADRDLHV